MSDHIKFEWGADPRAGMGDQDYADPFGDGSLECNVFRTSSWHWEVESPIMFANGDAPTQADARAMAEKVARFVIATIGAKT